MQFIVRIRQLKQLICPNDPGYDCISKLGLLIVG